MKLIFIGSSLWIIYYMRMHRVIKQTYDASEDTFRVLFLVAPSAVLALLINQKHNSPVEVCRVNFSPSDEHSAAADLKSAQEAPSDRLCTPCGALGPHYCISAVCIRGFCSFFVVCNVIHTVWSAAWKPQETNTFIGAGIVLAEHSSLRVVALPCRSCGRSPYTWRRSPSCRSWCCSSGRRTLTT